MIHIIKYSQDEIDIDQAHSILQSIKKIFPNDDCLMLPYGVDLLCDYPKESLIRLRDWINDILENKENNNNDL